MTTASSRDFGNLSPNGLPCNLRVMNNFQQFVLIELMGRHCLRESTAYGKALQSSSFGRRVKALAFRQWSGTICSMASFGNIFPRSHAAISAPTSAGSSIGAGGTHAGTPALDTRRVSAPGRPVRSPPHRFCVNMGGRLLVRSRAGRGDRRGPPLALVTMARIELSLTEGSHADH
jgi:hypothetical protein